MKLTSSPPVSPNQDHLPRSSVIVWGICLCFLALFCWAWFFKLEEVSTGSGKVIPSSREQIIQSLEGGIVKKINVKEGDLVEAGDILAQLDRTRNESSVQESISRSNAALATASRLRAEVEGTPLRFPAELAAETELLTAETALYHSRRKNLEKSLAGISQALTLVNQELAMTEKLRKTGAASDVEVLRLKRQKNELEMKADETRTQYYVRAREEMAKANAEVETQRSIAHGRQDALTRLTVHSPVRGIVKDIQVTTVGGVIPPNGRLMAIVPIEDQLLVEAQFSPRDVAFIHPGQHATVKISAYDYSIYGPLQGEVVTISPDTIQDEVKRDLYYYRVFIRTHSDKLTNKEGKSFPIFPGMIATADINTGSKTVLSYLMKPLNKAREAMRER